MNASDQKPESHFVERIGCGVTGLIALLTLSFGLGCVYDAAFSRGSGEWSSFAQVMDIVIDVPAGLAVFALAFTQRKGRRRIAFMALAGAILLIPAATGITRRARSAAYARELEKSLQHQGIPQAPPGTASK